MNAYTLLLKKIKVINFKKLNMLSKKIAKDNSKSHIYVKLDMLINFLTYGIGYTDYLKGNYINLNKKEKKTFVTTKNFFNLMKYLNDRKYRIIFTDKIVFNKMFKEYIKRDFIDIRIAGQKGLKDFLKNKETAFAKSVNEFRWS